MVSGFSEQTVEKQGSSVFCVRKSYEAERERKSPLERTSVFEGKGRRHAHPNRKIRDKSICDTRITTYGLSKAFGG